MSTPGVTPLSSAASVDAYLTHLAVERRLSQNTVENYARDLVLLARFAAVRNAWWSRSTPPSSSGSSGA